MNTASREKDEPCTKFVNILYNNNSLANAKLFV